jgi:replicative DNA helicase Mcm
MARDSGSMDVDKVMTGFSKTDRNKISVVRTLIHANSEPGKGVSFKTLLDHAPEKNLTEQELRDALKKLRNAGDIYEPSHDFYKLSSGD